MSMIARKAPVATVAASPVASLTLHRIRRALSERVRYRYVRPRVLQEGDAFRIQSPNCSRKVDPAGGVIDIALLLPHAANRWCLCSRDHAGRAWVAQLQNAPLARALDLLCTDPQRQYWP